MDVPPENETCPQCGIDMEKSLELHAMLLTRLVRSHFLHRLGGRGKARLLSRPIGLRAGWALKESYGSVLVMLIAPLRRNIVMAGFLSVP